MALTTSRSTLQPKFDLGSKPGSPGGTFNVRDGAVTHEVIAVADELRRQHGPKALIVVVVGGSAHKYHRFVGSVSMNLERVDRFPVLVVP